MSDKQLMLEVKSYLGITTDDDDVNRNILLKVSAVKQYLINGGAKFSDEVEGALLGCVAVGVNDLLNEKAGETKFSPAFNMLALQVCRG